MVKTEKTSFVSSTSGIGEKRKLEADADDEEEEEDDDDDDSSDLTAGTTATADTPPATLEPPDPKIRKAEGNVM